MAASLMDTVLCNSPFIPPEWIAAHGLRARRVIPSGHAPLLAVTAKAGVCPYAAAFVTEVSATGCAGVVIATTCDQARRVTELIEGQAIGWPVFVFHVPVASRTPHGEAVYREELIRLGRFLERLGGQAPTETLLADTMRQYDQARDALLAQREARTSRGHAEALMQFLQGSRPHAEGSKRVVPRGCGVPLALTGSPLMLSDLRIFDIVERAGGSIVLDGTNTGERALPRPFESAALATDPVGELVSAYFGHIPDVFRRPNAALYEWIDRAFAARGVRGIILRHYVWCDLWAAEAHYLRERAGMPVLVLDSTGDESALAREAGRIEAFLEALR